MTTMNTVLREALLPALQHLPMRMTSPEALVLLLAIGDHESGDFEHTDQVDPNNAPGPALGWWQFERAGGVKGVMTHPSTATLARDFTLARGIPFRPDDVWRALKTDQVLAAYYARLLLLSDPARLPALGDVNAAFNYYVRNWRPGAYDRGSPKKRRQLRDRFAASYREAVVAFDAFVAEGGAA